MVGYKGMRNVLSFLIVAIAEYIIGHEFLEMSGVLCKNPETLRL